VGGVVDAILGAVADLVTGALNAIIAALAVVIGGLFSLLPDMPDLPDLPTPFVTAESWVAWFFPVSTVVDILGFWLAMWLIWQVIALALRWAKALGED
jgi:amino acid transporter